MLTLPILLISYHQPRHFQDLQEYYNHEFNHQLELNSILHHIMIFFQTNILFHQNLLVLDLHMYYGNCTFILMQNFEILFDDKLTLLHYKNLNLFFHLLLMITMHELQVIHQLIMTRNLLNSNLNLLNQKMYLQNMVNLQPNHHLFQHYKILI